MSWCVITCKPSHTLDVVGVLTLHHLRAWTPTHVAKVTKPNRYPEQTQAVLPGFLFIDLEHLPYAEQIMRKQKLTPPFKRLKIDGRTVLMRDSEIQALKVEPLLTPGQTVCFCAGPLKGQRGTVEATDDVDILLNVSGDLKCVPSFLVGSV